jgi:hypothetical protein
MLGIPYRRTVRYLAGKTSLASVAPRYRMYSTIVVPERYYYSTADLGRVGIPYYRTAATLGQKLNILGAAQKNNLKSKICPTGQTVKNYNKITEFNLPQGKHGKRQ